MLAVPRLPLRIPLKIMIDFYISLTVVLYYISPSINVYLIQNHNVQMESRLKVCIPYSYQNCSTTPPPPPIRIQKSWINTCLHTTCYFSVAFWETNPPTHLFHTPRANTKQDSE